jgi:hypothetical protein
MHAVPIGAGGGSAIPQWTSRSLSPTHPFAHGGTHGRGATWEPRVNAAACGPRQVRAPAAGSTGGKIAQPTFGRAGHRLASLSGFADVSNDRCFGGNARRRTISRTSQELAGTFPARAPVRMTHPFKGNKRALPAKPCAVCGRAMTWRKAWAKNWESVLYCSDACRAMKKSKSPHD